MSNFRFEDFKETIATIKCVKCRRGLRADAKEINARVQGALKGDFPRFTIRETPEGIELYCPDHCHLARKDA